MNLIRSFNAVMFKSMYSIFDVVAWAIIISLSVNFSYWWFLTFIPVTFFSAYMDVITNCKVQYDRT